MLTKQRPLVAAATAVIAIAIVASAPAIAKTVADYARNAGKVDGIHAVKAAAGVEARAGKLVATNPSGYLPGGIIPTTPNARRIQGLVPSDIVRAAARRSSGHITGFDSSGFAGIHRMTVSAPGRGLLLMWGQFSIEWDEDSKPGTYASLVTSFAVDDERVGSPQVVEIERGTRRGTTPISLQAVVPVEAGYHKVGLQLRRSAGDALAYVRPRHTQTLFVPFGNNGDRGDL